MKKIYLFIIGLVAFTSLSKAQDTIFYEGFDFQMFHDYIISDVQPPPGNATDANWYDWDGDGLADASGATTPRKPGWFAVQPFSNSDTNHLDGSQNTAMGANSWLVSPYIANNWLVTPSIQLGPLDTLFWRSASSQTPRYLDGYMVKISTSTNADTDFNTTLFTAAQMTALGSDTTFSTFTFSPAGAFVHGADGTYIDIVDPAAANPLHRCKLRPFSVPLNTYANQKVFIAFIHNSTDDNLISIDDVMIRGKHVIGINENTSAFSLNIFPNPASDVAQLSFELVAETSVKITVYDVAGKAVYSENKGTLPNGRHFAQINTAALAKGFYTVNVQTNNGGSTVKLLVK